MARTTTPKPAPAATSRFQIEQELPASVRGSNLDPELTEAIRESHAKGLVFSLDIVADTPAVTRNGETRHDAKTAEQYIRRHASEAGLGVKVRDMGNGRVSFQGADKRVVPTAATGRKPRTPRAAA